MAPFRQVTTPAHLRDPNYRTGRPSLYRREYCDGVIAAAGQEGLSLTAFAGKVGVSRDTVYAWISEQRDFSDACRRAKAARVLWWEKKLCRSRHSSEVTASIFALRNAAPDEWRDIRSVEHNHNVNVHMMTDEQLLEIAGSGAPTIDVTPALPSDPSTDVE